MELVAVELHGPEPDVVELDARESNIVQSNVAVLDVLEEKRA